MIRGQTSPVARRRALPRDSCFNSGIPCGIRFSRVKVSAWALSNAASVYRRWLAILLRGFVFDGDHASPGRAAARVPAQAYSAFAACSAILWRRLSGLMSVHTTSIYSRHSDFEPSLPAGRQPAGILLRLGQMQYCASWLVTTM